MDQLVSKTDNYFLHVRFSIKSTLLRVLMKDIHSDILDKMFDSNNNMFYFVASFDGPILEEILTSNVVTIKTKVDLDKINNNQLKNILNSFKKLLLDKWKAYKMADNPEDTFEINFEELLPIAAGVFIEKLLNDDVLARILITGNYLSRLIEWISVEDYYLYKNTPNIKVGEYMKDKEALLKKINLAEREMKKLEDNPIAANKLKSDLDALKNKLKVFEGDNQSE